MVWLRGCGGEVVMLKVKVLIDKIFGCDEMWELNVENVLMFYIIFGVEGNWNVSYLIFIIFFCCFYDKKNFFNVFIKSFIIIKEFYFVIFLWV